MKIHANRLAAVGLLTVSLLLGACAQPLGAPTSTGNGITGGTTGGGNTGGSTGGSGGGGGTVAIMSHNAGTDCLSCHRNGGSGAAAGVFTVAGTVYRNDGGPQTAATVMLYPDGSTTAQASLTTDGLGNFWTTQTLAALTPAPGQTLVQGVKAVVRVTGGGSRAMLGVISNGSCNACHAPAGGISRVVAQQAPDAPVKAAAAASNGETLAVSLSPRLAQVTVGGSHSCVVKTAGDVLCWGDNSKGQLGGPEASAALPVAVGVLAAIPVSAADFSITSGTHHSCAVSAAGGFVRCWGANDKGQLGSGSTAGQADSQLSLAGVTAVHAAADSTCARVGAPALATIYCWGELPGGIQSSPQQQDLNDMVHLPSAAVPLLAAAGPMVAPAAELGVAGLEAAAFRQLSLNGSRGCGITLDDRLKCWNASNAWVDIPVH